MTFFYIHKASERRVFKVPTIPEVYGDQQSGYRVSLVYSDIQADNAVHPLTGQWKKAVQPYVEQAFSPTHTKQRAVEQFMARHRPKGELIAENEYRGLAAAYEAEAAGNL